MPGLKEIKDVVEATGKLRRVEKSIGYPCLAKITSGLRDGT